MKTSEFTDEVYHTVQDLKKEIQDKNLVFSDVMDGQGHQYVDLVMEGGGVLGIALVGFTYLLEQVGIRFLHIGGSSAGAINALLLASFGRPEEAKSKKILEALANLKMDEFVDGDSDVKKLVDGWIKGVGQFRMALRAAQVWDNIMDDLGLNPGKVFYEWVEHVLQEHGITTTQQLTDRMNQLPPGLHKRNGEPFTEEVTGLGLVAADVSTETKVVFPKMAGLYWDQPENVNPACFVRASMSIPFFFHPYHVKDIPQGEEAMDRWRALASYDETPPAVCTFIDGGIMSNFPIDLFHKSDCVPSAPTFGVKLGTDKRKSEIINTPTTLASAVFNSARHCLDYDFIKRNPDYRKLVAYIDVGDHDWLDFNMDAQAKKDLFRRGVEAAAKFLRAFNWEGYKQIRKGLADAATAAK